MQLNAAGKVLVIGDVMEDIIVRPHGPMAIGSDVHADIVGLPGGSGANQALWLAAYNVPVRFAARVGASDIERLQAHFGDRGVEPHLAGDNEHGTGRLITLLGEVGERSFFTDRAANKYLDADDLNAGLLDGVSLLHISAYSIFEDGPRAAILGLCEQAQAKGIAVSIDVSSTGFLRDVGAQRFLEWTDNFDLCFANEDEARYLTASEDLGEQMRILGAHYGFVVIKRGSEGAVAGGVDGISDEAPALDIEVVDTTGAGDAFFSGFIAALRAGYEIADCLGAGNAAGADAAVKLGGQPT